LEKKGLYYQLVTTQLAGHEDDEAVSVNDRDLTGDSQFMVRKSIPNMDDDDVVVPSSLPEEDVSFRRISSYLGAIFYG
jgi:hypothetical protein